MAAELQKTLQTEISNVKEYQKEYNDLRDQRQLLNGQLCENDVVKSEMDLMRESDEIYKLIGPVLIKQDKEKAKSTVAKRMDFIKEEIARINNSANETESKLMASRTKLMKIQALLREQKSPGNKK